MDTTTLQQAARLQLPAHIAIAPTPDLAHLSSLSPLTSASLSAPPSPTIHIPENPPTPHCLTIAQLTRAHAFPILNSSAEILSLWGIRTLGDLSDLPRQGLSERLGPHLTSLHDILHGKQKRLLKLHHTPTNFSAIHEFETPIHHFDPILFISRRLLTNPHQPPPQHPARRHRHPPHPPLRKRQSSHRHTLTFTETTLDPEIILRSLHTHLDTVRAHAPLTGFSLRLIPALPSHKQHEIFQKGLRDPHRFADTLHRLSSLVGHDRLGIPQIQDTHRPDQFEMHPVTPGAQTITTTPVEPTSHLPLSRLRPPVTISVMSEKRGRFQHPLAILTGPHRGQITNTAGPYPLSGTWWDRTWQQIQWDVELPQNRLLRLTHTPPTTWHLTGLYAT